jgi:hypothetical protein
MDSEIQPTSTRMNLRWVSFTNRYTWANSTGVRELIYIKKVVDLFFWFCLDVIMP